MADCDSDVDARRIVACVNACEGIGTEYLENFGGTSFNDFKRVKEQRDELLAALQQIERETRHIASAHIIARSAIKKVQP